MCKNNYRKHAVGASASMSGDKELILFAIAGGVGSAFIVNPVTKAIFKDDAAKSEKWAPAIKIGLGLVAMTQSDDERIQSAGFGAIIVGGVEGLQAVAPKIFKPIRAKMEGIGEVIDLNSDMYGIDDPYAVGDTGEYAVSGGVS